MSVKFEHYICSHLDQVKNIEKGTISIIQPSNKL